MGFKRICFKH